MTIRHRLVRSLPAAALLALSAVLAAQQPPPPTAAAKKPSSGPAAKRDAGARERDEREAREKRPDRLAPELDRILESKDLAGFWIDVTWPTGTNLLTSVRLYGDGVGTWNRATQFRLPPDVVRGIAEKVRDIHFGAFPLEVREEEEKKKPGQRDETELYGRIIVGAGDMVHLVKQMGDKPEPELEELAKKVIADSRQPASKGERVTTLDDGLRRVGDGTLAPQSLELVARRKVDKPAPSEGEENWMLRINGLRAVDRDMTKRPAVERELILTDQELKTLLALLRDAKVGTLPQSLWAPRYTTLRVQVLNQMRNVQARQFGGMTAQTHGAVQKSFDKVFEWCEKTHARAVAKGRVLPRQEQERETESDRERGKEKERD
jgi:hypothetical protein